MLHQIILMSLGAYVFQAAASALLPFPPPVLPPINPSLPTLPAAPVPVVLTSIPGAPIPNLPVTGLPPLPGVPTPSVGVPTGLPSVPGPSIPGGGLPNLPNLPTGATPAPGLPTDGFPPLPTLTNPALLSSISAVLGGVSSIPTALPSAGLPVPPLPPVGELPSLPTPGLPVPTSGLPVPSLPVPVPGSGGVTPPGLPGSVTPASIVTYLASAIEILLLLIRLIQETINTGGVRVPGVSELGVDVGKNLLPILLKVAGGYIDKAGIVGAIAL